MNNKGQTLAIFVIIVPIIVILLGSIIELSNIAYKKEKQLSVTKTIISKEYDEPDLDRIIKSFEDNDLKGDIKVNNDDGLEIYASIKIDSILGKIIGKDYYYINTDIKGIKNDNKIEFKKGVIYD